MTLIVPVLIVVVPHLASPTVRGWSLAHLSFVTPVVIIGVCVLCYWWWARSDACAREALRQIALHGRIALPAGDLTADDLPHNPSRVGSAVKFLPRRLRRFESLGDCIFCVAIAIPSLLPREDRQGRRVALIGAAAMGKTRLVHELVRQLPPDTIVFAPSRNLGSLQDASLRLSTRFLSGKSCVLVYDDLNFYVGRTDVAELEQVVAEHTLNFSTIVTCTTSTLPQLRSEAEPALRRFFSTLDQYELLQMTDEQMDLLAADPDRHARERDPKNCAGNPGLLFLDFQRLREEFNSLSPREVAIVEAIHTLFLAGITPITIEQVRALSISGFGSVLDIPIVTEALARLRLMSFIREIDPILPEEAFLREFVPEEIVWKRMDEVEGILWELGDARALFQLGLTHHSNGDYERSIRAMHLSARLNRDAGTPLDLANAARAAFNATISLELLKRPAQEVEAGYREVLTLGLNAAIPEIRALMAQALSNLGHLLFELEREPSEIEAVWRWAALSGRGAEAPGGQMAAEALFNLSIALVEWGREPSEIEATYREAASAGREATSPDGLVLAARALANLGDELARWRRPPKEVEAAYREAAAAGRKSCTPDGLVATANALSNLGVAFARLKRPSKEVEAAYREAAAAGFEAATPDGLAAAAQALFNLGMDLARWERPVAEVEATYRKAAAAGRESCTSDGLETAARALVAVGSVLARCERAPHDAEVAYGEAAEAGREAGTPEGLIVVAAAAFRLGEALMCWGREPQEIETAWRAAAAVARSAESPSGLAAAAQALLRLGDALVGWGREPQEVEIVLRDAALLGIESATPEGADVVDKVSMRL